MEDENDEEKVIEEDYYTFLNIPRNASSEEINYAYRRLSRLYHPDKHTSDPLKKNDAELLFHKTKKAYEVLNDPHKRAIYDSLGTKGLETEGWEIVQRTKTPQEIREEYERLAREREERRLQSRTNPRGNVTVKINATEMFAQYDEDEYEYDIPLVEISGMSISQSVEAPLTTRNLMTIGGEMSTHNGTGSGALTLTAKRLLQDNKWVEADLSVGNGVVLGLKHFRYLTRRIFGTGTLQLHFTDSGIKPGIEATLATQLSDNTMGYLTYRVDLQQSSMTTSIAHNTDRLSAGCGITLGIPHSFLSANCSYNFKQKKLKVHSAIKGGTFGALLEYSAEKKVSEQSSMSAMVSVGVPSGVRLRIKVTRARQTFVFPIHLCEEPLPSPVFYATVVPLIAYTIIKYTIIDPIVAEQEQQSKKKQQEANKNRMAQMKREAMAAVNLMGVTFSRIRATEEANKGVVIVKALYGRLTTLTEGERNVKEDLIDVTIPVQCLVKDAVLVLHDASKSQLPGFYDPCVGEDKGLYIQYLFHSHVSEVLCSDTEALRIPKLAHRITPT
ncbi:dnaJ homolog subfamily C member 11 [Macrosteles quadrilineatus]|uniref:dnaJ homolog subfamily C member 11 n=1 Tax=Macrosteles quadrilineatus TaxID=74068 RepID=UPI0023E20BAE|nr:dnaJ homolog subfamily C member 11 [Macrosteles quadrilineatus]